MARKQQPASGDPREPSREQLKAGEDAFRLLVESVVDYAIFMLDRDGRVVSWNAGAERVNGYREEQILGQHFSQFYPRDAIQRSKPQRGLDLALAEGRFEDEGWRVRKDGSEFWAHVVITAIRDKAGALLGFGKIIRDLTERQVALEKIKASEARLQAFMNHSPSLMFIKDLQGRYLHVNDRFTRAFALERNEIIFRTDREIFPSELAAQFQENDAKALNSRVGVEVEEVARYGDGLLHTSIVHKFPMFDGNGQIAALGGVATDITDRKRLEEMLKQKNVQLSTAIQTEITLREHQEYLKLIATHDALTGVANRALLRQRAEHALAVSRRSGHLLALLFIDLDRFKDINDRQGHAFGDEALREVATRLAGCLREVDTIARHGGDEFVALLEQVEGPEEVERVTARMREALDLPLSIEGDNLQVTVSIGVALYPRDGEQLSILLRRADLAMYRAKELGRNTVQFFTEDLERLR